MWMPVVWSEQYDNNTRTEDAVDRMFRDFWNDGLQTSRSMRTDVKERENDYQLVAEIPGVNKEDIHIEMKHGILTIVASHQENSEEKAQDGRYIRRERTSSSYQRSFRLGEEYKPEDISAKYENGVLTLTIPKKGPAIEKKESTRIEIH